GRRARRQNRGGDLRYNLTITLEEAFVGRSVQIKVPTAVPCEVCGGTGAEPGTRAEQCPSCAGMGKVRAQQGFFTIERTCPNCRGPVPFGTAALGGHVEVPTLDGGRTKVTVPDGTQSGRQFRMRGKGMPVMRGAGMKGDLYVEIAVETPVKLSRRQKELLREF